MIRFLRSSLVDFGNGCSFGSFLDFVHPVSALDIPVAIALACPIKPPPLTLTEISIFSLKSPVISNGAKITSRAVSCGIISTGTLLILTLPCPFVI